MKKTLLALGLFVALVGFYACNQTPADPTGGTTNTTTNSPDLMVPNNNIGTSAINDGSETSDIQLQPGYDFTLLNPKMCGNHFDMGRRDVMFFGRIFRTMNLTDTQKVAMVPFLQNYRDCYHAALDSLHQSEIAIIRSGNLLIKAVKDSLKAGVITRQQAMQAIHTINQTTRTSLKNNPAVQVFKDAVCACLTTLFADIRAQLTADQQVQWDAWVLTLNNPCFQ